MEILVEYSKGISSLLTLIPNKFYEQKDADEVRVLCEDVSRLIVQVFPKPKATKEQKRQHKKRKMDPSAVKKADDIEMEEVAARLTMEPPKLVESKPNEISDLKARLHAKIEQLRQRRMNSSNPKSKTELIDSRLKRNEEKQKRKKEVKVQQDSISKKRSAEHLDDEASTAVNSDIDAGKGVKEDISFGNISFGKEEEKKKKGPTDTLGKLKKVCNVNSLYKQS